MSTETIQAQPEPTSRRASDNWPVPPPFGWRTIAIVFTVTAMLSWSAQRVEIPTMIGEIADSVASIFQPGRTTQVGRGFHRVLRDLFPLQLSEETSIERVEGFDRRKLPWLARIEVQRERTDRLNPTTLRVEPSFTEREVLVEPLGYLWRVLVKTFESLEIALWGTLIALLLSAPLCVCAAKNYTPGRIVKGATGALIALLRAVPELISALFFVLAFGFGPIAGICALALHAAGFLAKFFAEDIENADLGPQQALSCLGINKLRVLWFAVLPQVFPKYVAYVLYILDRNVRMATVIGLVGAGGIGQELKGRYDMFNYHHVGTILVVLFVTVFALDQIAARLRTRLL